MSFFGQINSRLGQIVHINNEARDCRPLFDDFFYQRRQGSALKDRESIQSGQARSYVNSSFIHKVPFEGNCRRQRTQIRL